MHPRDPRSGPLSQYVFNIGIEFEDRAGNRYEITGAGEVSRTSTKLPEDIATRDVGVFLLRSENDAVILEHSTLAYRVETGKLKPTHRDH